MLFLGLGRRRSHCLEGRRGRRRRSGARRSEEHTSELQSLRHLVCRLLLEKKKIKQNTQNTHAKRITHHTHIHQHKYITCVLKPEQLEPTHLYTKYQLHIRQV